MDGGIVIVGAGDCGARTSLALRDQGFAGPVTLIGEETHAPYERPPVSKGLLADGGKPARIATPEDLAGRSIDFHAGARVAAIEPGRRAVVLGDGRTMAYERLLLATGCVPRRLPGIPDHPRILTLRRHDDALALRAHLTSGARLAIVGGGFIGLELAAAARQRGVDVTLIEAQPRLLARGVPAAIAEAIATLHRLRGVDIRCGAGIAGVHADDSSVELALADGTVVAADALVVGVGAVPQTALAAAAGLELDNGIAVDAMLRTSDPHILAAGDCCSFPLALYGNRRVRLESWRNALEQAAVAARNLAGGTEMHAAVPWFWSDQYDHGLQMAGLADEAVSQVRRDLGGGVFIVFHQASDGRLVAASGFGPGNAVARDIRLGEMLIARSARPPASALADAEVKLKQLLAA